MSSPMLSKGQNLPLPEDVVDIDVVIGWGRAEIEVDASALLLRADGKVSADSDFVFYNQPESPDGSVRFVGVQAADGCAQARIAIDLSALPVTVETVALVGSVGTGSFGELGELTLSIVDRAGQSLAQYATSDATTESAFLFGEVYRRGGKWKIRAVGQGWASGLAGLATDFGVDVVDEAELEPVDGESKVEPSSEWRATSITAGAVDSTDHKVGSSYRLWSQARKWCDYEVTVENEHLPAIRSLWSQDFLDGSAVLTQDVELVPEPGGTRGPWAISVRVQGRTIGYLGASEEQKWAGVVRRIVASGFVPTTASRIWAREYDGWDGVEFSTYVHIALGEPGDALPLNEPPTVPYTMLPRSGIVQVTKEDEHFDALLSFVPEGGYGLLFVTLHEKSPDTGRGKPHVEVRIDGQRVGQLTPQMSLRFLPMIRHLRDRGLFAACWGDIKGSAVAAKVRIDAIKANEASPEVLHGSPVTIPPLRPALSDPPAYDLTPLRSLLNPLPPTRLESRPKPAEPLDGSVVRFDKSGGHYQFVAVRRGNIWETTATGDQGSFTEVMSWKDLAARVRKFDIATAWSPVHQHEDSRVREYLAVVRFTIGRTHLAAINVCADGREGGAWYTTTTERNRQQLPFGDRAEWSEIVCNGRDIQMATAWVQLN
ncbi:TerD family protein [Nocardia vinacea]|uniref:TerD family protein n=1 Tax=Nocardia vinacea TaxID=96468 RepID=A0ABZ1YJR0_9NOCA|nr:TerD family protein [Nocardia vinacea]